MRSFQTVIQSFSLLLFEARTVVLVHFSQSKNAGNYYGLRKFVLQQLASQVSEDLAATKVVSSVGHKSDSLESRVLVLYTGGTIGMRRCGGGYYCPSSIHYLNF